MSARALSTHNTPDSEAARWHTTNNNNNAKPRAQRAIRGTVAVAQRQSHRPRTHPPAVPRSASRARRSRPAPHLGAAPTRPCARARRRPRAPCEPTRRSRRARRRRRRQRRDRHPPQWSPRARPRRPSQGRSTTQAGDPLRAQSTFVCGTTNTSCWMSPTSTRQRPSSDRTMRHSCHGADPRGACALTFNRAEQRECVARVDTERLVQAQRTGA